jgi:hypothetical protein
MFIYIYIHVFILYLYICSTNYIYKIIGKLAFNIYYIREEYNIIGILQLLKFLEKLIVL